jgi:hypothetical protein
MILHALFIAFALATAGLNDSFASGDANGGAVEASVSLATAVKEFNDSNKEAATWAGQQPLTEQELLAALVHETKTLTAETRQIAERMIDDRTMPAGVKLIAYRRHFADKHTTYLYQIKLSFDKGPVVDEAGKIILGRHKGESLTVRKQYLATQQARRGQELKSLKELLADSDK